MGGGKVRLCAAPERRRWRTVKNAAVEPSWALINNLLIYRGLSLKRRLQATEGCRRRRWRRADKTHSGGLLSAPRSRWRQFMRERSRERTKLGGIKKNTHTDPLIFLSIYKPFLLPEQIIGSFPPSRHPAPVHLAVCLENTMFRPFSEGSGGCIGPAALPVSSKSFLGSFGHRLRDAYVFRNFARQAALNAPSRQSEGNCISI